MTLRRTLSGVVGVVGQRLHIGQQQELLVGVLEAPDGSCSEPT